jgi:hypothetical protein
MKRRAEPRWRRLALRKHRERHGAPQRAVGPAQTVDPRRSRREGGFVRRSTDYRHFPDVGDPLRRLLRPWRALTPPPDLTVLPGGRSRIPMSDGRPALDRALRLLQPVRTTCTKASSGTRSLVPAVARRLQAFHGYLDVRARHAPEGPRTGPHASRLAPRRSGASRFSLRDLAVRWREDPEADEQGRRGASLSCAGS